MPLLPIDFAALMIYRREETMCTIDLEQFDLSFHFVAPVNSSFIVNRWCIIIINGEGILDGEILALIIK